MALAPEQAGIGIRRHFTTDGVHPYDELTWERRDARITNFRDGTVAFEQLDVEFPTTWSLNATNIVAQKYFRGTPGTTERESSLRQVIDRVADTITQWGLDGGYFVDEHEADTYNVELKHLLVNQKAAFNSPVWFNIGVPGVPQQGSACFILHVEDQMDSILNWYVEEGTIFKGGSGSGINLSNIRSSAELLKGGGTASGPVSFMRGADASAGTIKSGGKTRRAAKMVILNVDHPDVEEFVWVKAREEKKIRVLEEAGFDMSLDGKDMASVQYQNANNSVRVTDEFMQAVVDDADWNLRAVIDGSVVRTVKARDLMRQISQAAWECADPGMQFDTTINHWHTAANTGRINGSNPCSEYMHLDNSACNLASLNLLEFLDLSDDVGAGTTDSFDVEGFKRAVEIMFTGQEIIVGRADYPTQAIGDTSRAFRQLGIGYANLGAMLMALGLPYDSDEGRAYAAAITSLMTGHSYATSARTADRMGAFAGYEENQEHMLRVLRQHQEAAAQIDEELVPSHLLSAAQECWDEANELAATSGVRNSQASVLAPTGTIGLMMDCDTTGIEPDLGLCKVKKLVGGGTMQIVNQTVPRALARLGYSPEQAAEIIAYIDENKSILGAPHLAAEHVPVFACSMGDNTIHHTGHVRMMAAVQPFISGAISKTVNLPEEATVEEIEQLHIDAWKLGVKAIAIYRDNCKVAQPLSTAKKETVKEELAEGLIAAGAEPQVVEKIVEQIVEKVIKVPTREKMPAQPQLAHLRVPGGRLQGLRHGRRVRRRAPGRDLPAHLEAGLHPRRHHGRLRPVGELRPAVRRAAAGLRRDVHQHPLRAGRHDRRPRPADRQLHPRLHLPPPGGRLPVARGAHRAEHPHHRRAHAADPARRGGDGHRDPPGHGHGRRSAQHRRQQPAAVRHQRRPEGAQPPRAGRRHRRGRRAADRPNPNVPSQGLPQRRPLLHAVRRPDAAGRLLPRLPQLRQHQRLQLR